MAPNWRLIDIPNRVLEGAADKVRTFGRYQIGDLDFWRVPLCPKAMYIPGPGSLGWVVMMISRHYLPTNAGTAKSVGLMMRSRSVVNRHKPCSSYAAYVRYHRTSALWEVSVFKAGLGGGLVAVQVVVSEALPNHGGWAAAALG